MTEKQKVVKLRAEKIPNRLPVRAWVAKKDRRIKWLVENSKWRKTSAG